MRLLSDSGERVQRLTADGHLRPCLFSDQGVCVKDALAAVSGTSGLGLPLEDEQCGGDNLCMQTFGNGYAKRPVGGVVEVYSDEVSCPSCPLAPYSFRATPTGYTNSDLAEHACNTQLHPCNLVHSSTVWTHQDRQWGHKIDLKWRNKTYPSQSGTTVKVYRVAKALGAQYFGASTQVGSSFTLGTEEWSTFTDYDAVGNALNCYNLWVENSYGLVTALNPYIGYLAAAEVVKESRRTGKPVRQVTVAIIVALS